MGNAWIIWTVIGSVFGVAILCGLGYFGYRYKQRNQDAIKSTTDLPTTATNAAEDTPYSIITELAQPSTTVSPPVSESNTAVAPKSTARSTVTTNAVKKNPRPAKTVSYKSSKAKPSTVRTYGNYSASGGFSDWSGFDSGLSDGCGFGDGGGCSGGGDGGGGGGGD